jgi:hypothetical protein
MYKLLFYSCDSELQTFEGCRLIPVNPEKVLEMIPSVAKTAESARHLDAALLHRLEVRRFGEASKKRPRGQKVPAGQSYTEMEEEESTDERTDKEDDEDEDES